MEFSLHRFNCLDNKYRGKISKRETCKPINRKIIRDFKISNIKRNIKKEII